jgi:superfamily I DNA/RNA helicase
MLTPQQKNIITAKDKFIIVDAFAGCAKTTTIIHRARSKKGKCLYLAFNTANVKDISSKLPDNWECRTIHAHALKHLNIASLGLKIDNSKYKWLETSKNFSKLYNMRAECPNIPSSIKIDSSVVSFNDMLLLPVMNGLKLPEYEEIIIDECQDLTQLQFKYISAISTDSIVFSGDKHQAIYLFAGGDPNMMSNIEVAMAEKMGTPKIYHLDFTFRFGQDICDVVNASEILQRNIETACPYKSTVEYQRDVISENVFNTARHNPEASIAILVRTNKEKGNISRYFKQFGKKPKNIKVLTIHKSKGLEFDIVIVPDAINFKNEIEYSLHIDYSSSKHTQLINMYYVAITRAKHKLILEDNYEY